MNNELLDWLNQWIMNYWINELELIGSSGALPVTTYTLYTSLKPPDFPSVRRLSSFSGRWAGGRYPGLDIVGSGRLGWLWDEPLARSLSECGMRRPFLCWPFPISWGCGEDIRSGTGERVLNKMQPTYASLYLFFSAFSRVLETCLLFP